MRKLESLSLRFDGACLQILDQSKLPAQELWLDATDPNDLIDHIKALRVRGAPLIGVAAALCLACLANNGATKSEIFKVAKNLRAARPTAVNLMHAIDQILAKLEADYSSEMVIHMAEQIFHEDVKLCQAIADNGVPLIQPNENILTHCNTGGLATAGVGTALGVIKAGYQKNKNLHIFVDETRPLNQGSRLTTWELERAKIPYTLICDSMAGALMSQGRVTKVILGADRIARNGDFANKIGTYTLAVLARHHSIPFYVAAPFTTVDFSCENGRAIPIEERHPSEVRAGLAPENAPVFNPAFDVTPAELVTGYITDKGLLVSSQIANKEDR